MKKTCHCVFVPVVCMCLAVFFTVAAEEKPSLPRIGEVEDFLRQHEALEVGALAGLVDILPQEQGTDAGGDCLFGSTSGDTALPVLEKGTWEYVNAPIGNAPAGTEMLHIRDNKWNHLFLFFKDGGYCGCARLCGQRSVTPAVAALPSGPQGADVLALMSLGTVGQLEFVEAFTFYRQDGNGYVPVMTALKNGYVHGGDSMSDRKYEGRIDTAVSGDADGIVLTYKVSYFGDTTGYSYDQRFTEESVQKMLLSTVEKKARFAWDAQSGRYVFDREGSSLAEEDREILVPGDEE